MNPQPLSETCGLCNTPVIFTGDWQACVRCDLMLEWPRVELHPSVILMAHSIGVGKLPR